MDIHVVLAFADKQYLVTMDMPEGTTLRQAAVASFEQGLIPHNNREITPDKVALGVYGEIEADDYILSDGDRVEIYRPLLQDPKEWRRQRANLKKNLP